MKNLLFTFTSAQAILEENKIEKEHHLKAISLLNDISEIQDLYGFQYFPQTFNFCLNLLKLRISNHKVVDGLFSGKWIIYLDQRQLGRQLNEIFDKTKLSLEIGNFKNNTKSCLFLKCGPFFEVGILKENIANLEHELNSMRTSTYLGKLTSIYIPDIISLKTRYRKNGIKPYIFKTTLNLKN